MAAVPAYSQGDEVEAFFGGAVVKPSRKEADRLTALLRKVQIGEKYDRSVARVEIVEQGRAAVPRLLEDLLTDNAEDSRNAAMALARIADTSVRRQLRGIVAGDSKGNPRHAAFALGAFHEEGDVDLLFAALKATRRNERRRAFLHAIGRIGSPEASRRLAGLWESERGQEFRCALLLAAGRCGGPSALKLIRKGLASNKESVRGAATLALSDLADPAQLGRLRARLADSDSLVVRHAAIGLARMPVDAVVKLVQTSALLRHKDEVVRAHAALALGRSGTPPALALLLPRLKAGIEREPVVRRALAFALGRFADATARAALRRLLSDRDATVAMAALCAVALRPQGTGVTAFEGFLHGSQRDEVRSCALDLFAWRLPRDAGPWIDRFLEKNDDKKKMLEQAAELRAILERPRRGAPLLRARVQVRVDELGGSPEWNLLAAMHDVFLVIEGIHRPLTGRGPGPPGSPPRPPDRWSREEEDMRIWYDLYPYQDRREVWDVPEV